MIGRILIFLVKVYQVTLSPMFGRCCRYYPSCSQYCITAIENMAAGKVLPWAAWRLCRAIRSVMGEWILCRNRRRPFAAIMLTGQKWGQRA